MESLYLSMVAAQPHAVISLITILAQTPITQLLSQLPSIIEIARIISDVMKSAQVIVSEFLLPAKVPR
jgi:hypothetical protein